MSGDKASKIVERARELAGQGEIDRAIAECLQTVARHPEPEVYQYLGELFLKNQMMPEAIDAYDQAAQLFLKEESVANGVSCYKQILKIEPNRANIWILLGDMNAGRGQINHAVADYLTGAKLFVQNAAVQDTCRVYRKILALAPHNTCVRLRLAELHLKQGDIGEGLEEFLRAADEYERHQREPEARALYEAILKHSPDHPEASRRLGLTKAEIPGRRWGLSDKEGAPNEIDRMDQEGADQKLGVSHPMNGNSDDEIALDAVPGVEMRISEGKVLDSFIVAEDSFPSGQESVPGGERDFPSAISSELEEELEAQYELALAYKEMGLLDEAIETFEQALRGPSRFLDSCTMIAMCYKDRRLNKAAIAWLERASHHPRCEGALALSVKLALAQLYEAEGHAEKAAHLYGCIPAIHQAAARMKSTDSPSRKFDAGGGDTAASSKLEKPEKPRRISFF